MDTEQRAIEMRTWAPRHETTRTRIATALVLTAVATWFWVFPPAFLSPPEPPSPSFERVEAGLRLAVALHADRVEQFRSENGRLPDALREVGDTFPGMRYTRVDVNTFRLHAREDVTTIRYEAGLDSMSVVLRNALTVLREER